MSTARGPDAREAAKIVSILLSNCGFEKTKYGQKIIETLRRFIHDISWRESGDSGYRATRRLGFGSWCIFSEEIYIKKKASTNRLPEDIIQALTHESVHAYYGPRSPCWAQEEVQAHWAEALVSVYLKRRFFPADFKAIGKTFKAHAEAIFKDDYSTTKPPFDYVDRRYVKGGSKKWEGGTQKKFPSNKLKGLWYK